MNDQLLAERVAAKMMEADAFSQWLGIELMETGPGSCRLEMTVRPEMLNGFGRCHGGVIFSLADSALAFACNTHGRVSVSIENSLAYPAPVFAGDHLTAVAEEQSRGRKVAVYHVSVTNQKADRVGVFRGTVYRTDKRFFEGTEEDGTGSRGGHSTSESPSREQP